MALTAKNTRSFLHITRLPLALSAVADIWLVALWGYLVEGYLPEALDSLWQYLACSAGVGVGMYAFGSTLNDILDARRDRLFNHGRPIPADQMTVTTATIIAFCGLITALACAVPLGTQSTLTALVCGVLVMFYNAIGKHLPAIGVICLAAIRAGNMMIAFPGLDFLWPVWLNLTHVMFTAALIHRLAKKRPYLVPQELWALTAGWVFWTLLMIFWMSDLTTGREQMPWLWFGPIVAGLAAIPAGAILLRSATDNRHAARLLRRGAAVWLIIYDASWFASIGLWRVAALFGWLLAMTLLGLRIVDRWGLNFQRSSAYQADRPSTM